MKPNYTSKLFKLFYMTENDKRYAFLIKIGPQGGQNHEIGSNPTNIT
jgi:hypothetical protein